MGKSNKQTIGYKYYLGMHMVIAQQIDAVLAIKFQNKTAWRGMVQHGRIRMNKPKLFGGKKKEGGVSGGIDVMDGRPTQGKNSYLRAVLGERIPAFRGVASLVFRRCYLGNNPYIKPVSVKGMAIHSHFDDWYPEKAEIAPAARVNDAAIYIALDHSLSMTPQRMTTMRTAVAGLINSLRKGRNDVRIVTYNDGIGASITRMNAKGSDYDDLENWINTPQTQANGNQFSVALSQAEEFFSYVEESSGSFIFDTLKKSGIQLPMTAEPQETRRRIALIITDGEIYSAPDVDAANAIIDGIEGLEVFGFNIDTADTYWTSQIDNTSADGVPIIQGSDPDALEAALSRAFTTYVDMNPAHILRDLWVAPSNGGSGDPSEIDDSFTAAADLFHQEGLGFSFEWANSGSKAEFQKIVEKHADASCYIDTITGKWAIKPIRDDYDVANLITFGDGGIPVVSWGDVSAPNPRELPNQVTVVYTKRSNGEDGSVTIANVAALQVTGRIKAEKVEYEGVTRRGLASRLCMRDLAALTTPLLSGSLTAAYVPPEINLGSPILIHEPRLGINNRVVRVTEMPEGDGRDNSVLVRFIEDKFAIGDEDVIPEDVDDDDDDAPTVEPSEVRMVEEAPYYAMVQAFGQQTVDDNLASEPDLGRLIATGNQPTGTHLNAQLAIDAGTGYQDGGTAEFSPAGVLDGPLLRDPTDTTATIPVVDGLNEVEIGSLARIGAEIVRVDDMVLTGETVELTLGRGCLDTVPEDHPAGASILFWQVGADIGDTDYLLTEQIDVKFLPQTGAEILHLSEADVDEVTFASRASLPYPVGQLKVDGSYAPVDFLSDTATLTWAHRDRTAQTTGAVEDHTTSSIGPEPGVSYHATLRTVEAREDFFAADDYFGPEDYFIGDGRRAISEVAVSPADGTTHDIEIVGADFFDRADYFGVADYFDGCFTDSTIAVEVGIITRRDGYENWQTPFVRCKVLLPPVDLTAEVI